jgi:hypothetical protein
LRRPLRRLQSGAERAVDGTTARFRAATRNRPRARTVGQAAFTLAVTSLLIPFVLQPTLVADYSSRDAWLERGANLVDGTASRYLADSVIGLYRKAFAEPIPPVGGVSAEQDAALPDATHIPPTISGDQPLMDRWDPIITRVAAGDHQKFAFIKAFMWVESAGRQFAVSSTGCSGLMQFCSGTARSKPYRKIFGVGQVYTCQCDGPCRIPRRTRRALETGLKNAAELGDQFPCEPSDARFDPDRSIRAGALYIERLAARFDDNIYLMYIGYNSGPAVAGAVSDRLHRPGDATLADIEPYLVDAMRPYYGAASQRRARSLIRTHLPKIHRAFAGYYSSAKPAQKVATR